MELLNVTCSYLPISITLEIIVSILFHLVLTSFSNFSSALPDFFCSSLKKFKATLLRLKKVTMCLTLQISSLNCAAPVNASPTIRFNVWAKHGRCGTCNNEHASLQLAALSVTMQITFSLILNSVATP